MADSLSAAAEADLDEIWFYIATESSNAEVADRLIELLTYRMYLLAQMPRIGRRRDEDLRLGTRSFAVGSYVILYRIAAEEDVMILRVVHGRRDIFEID